MKSNVLIVGPEYTIINILSIYFDKANIEYNWVKTAKEAVSLVNNDEYTCIITDVILSGATGIELVDRLHNDILLTKLPVIIITSLNITSEISKRLRVYENISYFQKPVNPIDIFDRIMEYEDAEK